MRGFDQVRANIRRAYEAGRASVRTAHEPAFEPDDFDDGEPVPEPNDDIEHRTTASRDDSEVPKPIRLAAAWGWRLLVVIAVATVFLWLMGRLHRVVIPVAIAMLLSALLAPAVAWLRRKGVHRTLATVMVMIGGLALVAGTLTLVITEFVDNAGNLGNQAQEGLQRIQNWLQGGVFHLTDSSSTTW